ELHRQALRTGAGARLLQQGGHIVDPGNGAEAAGGGQRDMARGGGHRGGGRAGPPADGPGPGVRQRGRGSSEPPAITAAPGLLLPGLHFFERWGGRHEGSSSACELCPRPWGSGGGAALIVPRMSRSATLRSPTFAERSGPTAGAGGRAERRTAAWAAF